MDEERDGVAWLLSGGAIAAALLAWAPVGLYVALLGVALLDPGGLGCEWSVRGGLFAMGAAMWAASVGALALLVSVGAVVRAMSSPELGPLGAAFAGLMLSLAAIPSSLGVLWVHGVFNDGLC